MTTCILKLGDRVTCETLGAKQTGVIVDLSNEWAVRIRLETFHPGGIIRIPLNQLTRIQRTPSLFDETRFNDLDAVDVVKSL